jgi:hypothetical protein
MRGLFLIGGGEGLLVGKSISRPNNQQVAFEL